MVNGKLKKISLQASKPSILKNVDKKIKVFQKKNCWTIKKYGKKQNVMGKWTNHEN